MRVLGRTCGSSPPVKPRENHVVLIKPVTRRPRFVVRFSRVMLRRRSRKSPSSS